jgi:thymidylate synthase
MSTINTIKINMKTRFKNANEAYEGIIDEVLQKGIDFGDTKAIFNCGFYIDNPSDKVITNTERNWNQKYAAAEWAWYLSGDPSINKLGELYGSIPPIWKRMADSYGLVNSNYGYQWQRNNQLGYVVDKLREDTDTRQAVISIYDAKETI